MTIQYLLVESGNSVFIEPFLVESDYSGSLKIESNSLFMLLAS